MSNDTRTYTNGEITVVWKSNLCKHTGICLRGLPKVFNLRQRPWINMTAASSEEITHLVDECPSGALTIEGRTSPDNYSGKSPVEVVMVPKGPLIIKGDVVLKDLKGREVSSHERMTILCRCGASKNFPLCDASHVELMKKREE